MALKQLSSFVPPSHKTPLWLPLVLACFLLQTLIPNGYMPGNLSSGEGALVFCGDTAFLHPGDPEVSELLKDLHASERGSGSAHPDSLHDAPVHNSVFSEASHCLFSLGGQLYQTSPTLIIAGQLLVQNFGLMPLKTDGLATGPDYIRPLLRAPPRLSS